MRWVMPCLVACALAGGARAQSSGDPRRLEAIKQACAVGALPASECGGRPIEPAATDASAVHRQLYDSGRSASSAGSGQAFSDPQGRYRLALPAGWQASVQGDTLSLTRGQAWIQLVATSAESPQAAAEEIGQKFEPAFRHVEMANHGPATFGNHEGFGIGASGASAAQGQTVSVLVMAISAGSGHDLVVVSAVPMEQAPVLNRAVIAMANSIRFRGE